MIDIYHSRRGHFNRCSWYKRDEKKPLADLDKWILDNKPAGFFYAKETTTQTNQMSSVSGVIAFDKNYMTLMTMDETEGLSRGCVVTYAGHPWIVDSVQREIHMKETEFSREKHCSTVISMRR